MGFLPMTRNAVNDPKVRYEVGDGGAPKEEGEQLLLLEKTYQEGTRILQGLGYNGCAFDQELPCTKKSLSWPDDERKIEKL